MSSGPVLTDMFVCQIPVDSFSKRRCPRSFILSLSLCPSTLALISIALLVDRKEFKERTFAVSCGKRWTGSNDATAAAITTITYNRMATNFILRDNLFLPIYFPEKEKL